MSNRTLSRFCRSGDLSHYHRRFHNLSAEQRKTCAELVESGVPVDKALRQARKIKS